MGAVQASSKINNMLDWANCVTVRAKQVTVGLFNGALCTEHNGTMFVAIGGNLDESRPFYSPTVITFDRLSVNTCTFRQMMGKYIDFSTFTLYSLP